MDRRKECRLDLEMPVRIWGVDRLARPFAEIVRAGNVSARGAVLTGVRSKNPGRRIVGRSKWRRASSVSHYVDQSFGRGRHRGSGI